MALADLCGFNGSKVLNNKQFSTNAFEDEIMQASGNMVNNYQLAMPPYSNVRLTSPCFFFFSKQYFGRCLAIALRV